MPAEIAIAENLWARRLIAARPWTVLEHWDRVHVAGGRNEVDADEAARRLMDFGTAWFG